ncbi:MAG: putative bifunctional diguanylate cyclase/phosphodiesterase [Saccharospirillum sp.]
MTRASKPEDWQSEILRLNKIIEALMNRAERTLSSQGSDFSLFQTALTLEQTVRDRTRALEQTLRENERINRDLQQATEEMEAEIRKRQFEETLRESQFAILEMIATDQDLEQTLTQLVDSIDRQIDDGMTSLLMLSGDGQTIGQSIGPSLPRPYNEALIGLPIGPRAGSCGTAMFLGEPVIVEDIASDPKWAPYRELALGYQLHSCWSTPIITSGGQVLGSIAIYHRMRHRPDVKERRLISGGVHLAGIAIERSQAESQIRHMAHHDALTDLANRSLMEDRVNQAILQVGRDGGHAALLLIDLDRFKNINDSLGHQTGDSVLRQVAKRLLSCVRASDTLARLGGDEFVICVPHLSDTVNLSRMAEKLLQALDKPFELADMSLHIGASIGIALYPQDGRDSTELLRNADAAMYAAKDSGRGNFQYFTPELNASAHERLLLISQLRQAFDHNEFELFFQPIVEVDTAILVGAEALLRWHHPERGLITPDVFIPILEETGMMVKVGAWVLQQACQIGKSWQQAGIAPIRLAVNLSAVQFYQSLIFETVRDALQSSQLDPEWLTLEFTEAILLADTESVIQTIYDLKSLGVSLALDDFGTGYSSLSYLQRFPVDRLKIDRSFLLESMNDSHAAHIVQSIVQLADKLGLISVAEGIETEAQLGLMRRFGCNELQGYLFSRPLPAEQFAHLLQNRPEQASSRR